MQNILRETIEDVLKDVHIETGRKDEYERLIDKLEHEIALKILSHDIDYYTECLKV